MRFSNVNPGERFRPTATEWNMIRKMLAEWSGDSGVRASFNTTVASGGQTVIRIKNTTAKNVPSLGILEISEPLFAYDEQRARRNALNHGVSVKGVVPTGNRPVAICLKSIPKGRIGQAVIDGPIPCVVDIKSESHKYANPVADETDFLESADSGDFRILAKPNGVGKMVVSVTRSTASTFIDLPYAIHPFVGVVNGDIKAGLDTGNANHGGEITLFGATESVRAFAGMLDGDAIISDGKRVEGLRINDIYRIFNADCENVEEEED